MYIVMELQTNKDGTLGSLITTYDNEREAESKYHTILASAAISGLPKHTALIMTEDGMVQMARCFVNEDVANE